MDATFWTMAAVTFTCLAWAVVRERHINRLLDERDATYDLVGQYIVAIDRLTREAEGRPSRGARGRFTQRQRVTTPTASVEGT